MLLGNNHLGSIFAEVITIKTLFYYKNPRKLPTAEVNLKDCIYSVPTAFVQDFAN